MIQKMEKAQVTITQVLNVANVSGKAWLAGRQWVGASKGLGSPASRSDRHDAEPTMLV